MALGAARSGTAKERNARSRSSFAAPSATSPSQFPTQFLFQTIYFLSLLIIPRLLVMQNIENKGNTLLFLLL